MLQISGNSFVSKSNYSAAPSKSLKLSSNNSADVLELSKNAKNSKVSFKGKKALALALGVTGLITGGLIGAVSASTIPSLLISALCAFTSFMIIGSSRINK